MAPKHYYLEADPKNSLVLWVGPEVRSALGSGKIFNLDSVNLDFANLDFVEVDSIDLNRYYVSCA